MNRNDLRRLEKAAREKDKKHLAEWANDFENQLEYLVRKEYEARYQDEIQSSIENFIIATAYTAVFSESTNLLESKELPEFMEDLFTTIELFRTGEYKPKDYEDILKENGLEIDKMKYEPRKHKVITLCGSTKFKDDFMRIQQELTLKGYIVLSVGVFVHDNNVEVTEKQKKELDEIHKDKIRMSDAIYVIDRDGYIGDSTKSEIEFAKNLNKTIYYMEKEEKYGKTKSEDIIQKLEE